MEASRDLIDVDGRPIGELASRRYDTIETEIVACPYHDARRGLPMNKTALRQLSSCWPEVVQAAAALSGPDATVHRAWWACIGGTTAPRIHHERFGRPIPRVLSSLYKGSLGYSQVLTALLLAQDGLADVPLSSLGDSDAFFALLDDGKWLVGQVQACAGPAPMIGQLLMALGDDAAEPPPDLAALGDPAPWTDAAATWVGLQVAFLGAARVALRRDGGPADAVSRYLDVEHPWLRAVLQTPDRQPEHARRLFPAGQVPDLVEAFLAEGPATVEVLADRLATGRRQIPEL